MSFTVTFVGAGNTGRSVLAAAVFERALREVWPDPSTILVLSAGTDVIAGMPIAPHTETVAVRRGLDVDDHTAVDFARSLAESTDLVLAMARRQRAGVLLRYPWLRGRAFTLLEFEELLHHAGRRSVGARQDAEAALRAATIVVRRVSGPPPVDDAVWDLADPYAQTLDRYEHVADRIDAATRDLVLGVAGRAAAPLPAVRPA